MRVVEADAYIGLPYLPKNFLELLLPTALFRLAALGTFPRGKGF